MTTAQPPVRVLVVHHEGSMRRGLQAMLERHAGVTVVGEATSPDSAVRATAATTPGVVVMALRLPDLAVIEACRRIRSDHPRVKVLVLTSLLDHSALLSAMFAGASGYALRDLDPAALQKAVIEVGNGGTLLDTTLAGRAIQLARSDIASAQPSLTPLEDRVLDMVEDGQSDREIAERLGLTPNAIRERALSLYDRLIAAHRV